MYYPLAQQEFESYLNGYDRENDRIKLKIIHTYGVVKQAEELAGRMHLSAEDTDLARLIALLHDIGKRKHDILIQRIQGHGYRNLLYQSIFHICQKINAPNTEIQFGRIPLPGLAFGCDIERIPHIHI